MKVFSTPEFKHEFEKLIKNNSYKYLSKEIISKYFGQSVEEVSDGVKLNGNALNAFIKKRIGGSGGSRLYLLIIQTADSVYFTFIHPKTGSAGYENITSDKKAQLLEDVYDCISKNNLYELSPCEEKKKIIFSEVKTVTV
ncbi:hypothetical protein AM493_13960 [Flavobacterium akiainvivens]|uniref:Addiction module toxin RelE n=1 Tax=Flavobacterium akiainvivens TaxID=1202724 RepID=A0A0M8ME76_9FLAO|nr:hypothetical protein [Flavobacterium akiainvivens]KOS07014.1 hypothetical protein AM493_13960 [Flavobacterium akiainvivens]SFQ59183.1 hypothetical protein SAMN05444144_10984 [Flavobacterium akiainvivens]